MRAIRWAGRWALGIGLWVVLVGGAVAYLVACYWLISRG